MKTHSRLTALMLMLFTLISLISCSAGGDTTDTSDMSSPETTATVTAETTPEPVISVVAPPETTEEITEPLPEPEDTLLILKEKGLSLGNLFSAEENAVLQSKLEERFLREHKATVSIGEADDIIKTVTDSVAAGAAAADLLMLCPDSGITLLTRGLLEDLGMAGISINSNSTGVRKSLTESLVVGGTYLIACDALSSYLPASYALKYDGTALSSDPVQAVLSDKFTVELMLTYISEKGEGTLAIGSASPLIVYRGVGGHIFAKDENGMPVSAPAKHEGFSGKYRAALELYAASSSESKGIFTLTKLSPDENAVWLPLPKESESIEYSTPLDTEGVVLFAAPAGVIDGRRLATLFNAYNLVASDYRDAARAKLAYAEVEHSADLLTVIESSATIDLGPILGWGNIHKLLEDELKKGTSPEDILADRVVQMQNKAVESAAAILAGRLNIN